MTYSRTNGRVSPGITSMLEADVVASHTINASLKASRASWLSIIA